MVIKIIKKYSKYCKNIVFFIWLYNGYTVLQVPIDWEVVDVTPVKGPDGKFGIPQAAIDSVKKNQVGLKGPLATPIGKGHRSLNLALRK